MTASTLTGSLLVATPLLDEPPFRRSVILLLDHDEDGALGVVVNRAADLEVERVLSDWSETVNEHQACSSWAARSAPTARSRWPR